LAMPPQTDRRLCLSFRLPHPRQPPSTARAQLSRQALVKSRLTEQYSRRPTNVHVDVSERSTPNAQFVQL